MRFRTLLLFIVFSAFIAAYGQVVVPGDNFGYTQGVFGVSDGGAATYSIPLTLPQGTAGLQPSIGLSYNSNSGNGIVGVGWNLQGLSSIVRSGRNRSQDENTDKDSLTKAVSYALTYSNQDRFVLDGQRLVLAPESILAGQQFDINYGNNETVYYKEQHDFTKVVFYTNASGGYFKAFTKEGLIYFYGNSTDAKVISNSVAIVWKVNRIEDRKGNFITFSYSYDATTGEILPTQINYTGNANTGLQPYNSVVFDYENRPDISTSYGIRYQQKNTFTKRLQKIRTLYQGALVREYRLTYQLNGFSLLSQITECDANGNCFQPTVFNWQVSQVLPHRTAQQTVGIPNSTKPYVYGDFTGDGLVDVIRYGISETQQPGNQYSRTATVTLQFYINNGDNTFTLRDTKSVSELYYSFDDEDIKVRTAELNGDNIDDVAVTFQDESNVQQFVSNPSATDPYQLRIVKKTVKIPNMNPHKGELIDLNGDALADFWRYNEGTERMFSRVRNKYGNTDTTTYTSQISFVNCLVTSDNHKLLTDFNADGLTDILFVTPLSGTNTIVIGNADLVSASLEERINRFRLSFSSCQNNTINTGYLLSTDAAKYFAEDLNADNLKEIVVFNSSQNLLRILPNRGSLTFDAPIVIANPLYNGTGVFSNYPNLLFNDVNADGLTDLVFYEKSNGINLTYLNQGNFSFSTALPHIGLFPSDMLKSDGQFKIGAFQRGGETDVIYKKGASLFIASLGKKVNTMITAIVEGTALKTEIEYSSLLDTTIHARIGTGVYPYIDLQIPLYAVQKVRKTATNGEKRTQSYIYLGAAVHVEGRGFRGFSVIQITDSLTKKNELKTFFFGKNTWMYASENNAAIYQTYKGKKVLSTDNAPDVIAFPLGTPSNQLHRAKSFFAYSKSRIITDSLSGKKLAIRQNVDDSGRYGNMKYVVNDYGVGLKDSTVFTYHNDAVNWIIGRPTTVTKYHFAPNQTTFVEQKTFEYEPSTGLKTKETAFSNLTPQERIETTLTYDAYGNVIQTDVKAGDGTNYETRTTQNTYDSKGRFVLTAKNPLNHTAVFTYDERLGVLLTSKDPNNLTDQNEYDGFGRVVKQTAADGSWKSTAYRKASSTLFNSPGGAVYLTYQQSSNGQIVLNHYDSYTRSVQTSKKGFSGVNDVVSTTLYGRNGILETTTNYYAIYRGGSLGGYAKTEYDVFGRISKLIETKTGGVKTDSTYYGWLSTTKTNFLKQTQTLTYDAKGQIASSGWNGIATLNYYYDAAGRQTLVIDLKGNTYTSTYDARGNKVQTTDPDMGTYQYQYNGFGELIKQIYPNGKTVVMEYDKLGRIIKQTEEEGITTWTYDVGNKAIGKLSSVVGYSANSSYTYDAYGRKSQEVLTVAGTDYTTQYTYDTESRLLTLTYPNNFVLRYIYNAQGYLSELRNNTANALLWKVVEMDAFGNIAKQQFGNGVITEKQYNTLTQYLTSIKSSLNGAVLQQFAYNMDDLGNLLYRQDTKRAKTETFVYDATNRLTQSNIAGGTVVNVSYDELGNITSKSAVGLFEYGSVNNGPHRLVTVRANNPNITCSFSENINTLYTTFNKVKQISNDTSYVDISYGPDRMRVLQKMYVRNALVRTKLYIGGIAEIELFANGKKITTNYLAGIGLHTTEEQGNTSTAKTTYFLKDHLGSITGFTGDNGLLLEELSFDAWGSRRNADWTPLTASYKGFERGFTYHEHYDLFSMIEMNGRVYDPILGRFLSPDIVIQDPLNLQNFNRYSYVLNNPLKFVDPTGYVAESEQPDGLAKFTDLITLNKNGYEEINTSYGGSGDWQIPYENKTPVIESSQSQYSGSFLEKFDNGLLSIRDWYGNNRNTINDFFDSKEYDNYNKFIDFVGGVLEDNDTYLYSNSSFTKVIDKGLGRILSWSPIVNDAIQGNYTKALAQTGKEIFSNGIGAAVTAFTMSATAGAMAKAAAGDIYENGLKSARQGAVTYADNPEKAEQILKIWRPISDSFDGFINGLQKGYEGLKRIPTIPRQPAMGYD